MTNLRLNWTEPSGPNKECSYDHTEAPTPFGRILLTWKSWKDDKGFYAEDFPGAFSGLSISSSSLEDAKLEAEDTYFKLLTEAAQAIAPTEDQLLDQMKMQFAGSVVPQVWFGRKDVLRIFRKLFPVPSTTNQPEAS